MKHDSHLTKVSRREVMTLGMAGLTWLLIPCKDVLADSHTLADQIRHELEETAENFISEGIPQIARSGLEGVFRDQVRAPVLSDLQILGASFEERTRITLALDEVQDVVGDVTEDWASRILKGGNIVDTLKLSLDARFDQPTFPPPFNPGFEFDIGIPKPSTSQSPLDMLQRLRVGEFPIDPDKLIIKWDVFDLKATSTFDKLRLRGSVEASNFFDPDFQLKSPAWKAKATLDWDFIQNGALNNLSAEIFGEFNREGSGDVWGVLVKLQFRF